MCGELRGNVAQNIHEPAGSVRVSCLLPSSALLMLNNPSQSLASPDLSRGSTTAISGRLRDMKSCRALQTRTYSTRISRPPSLLLTLGAISESWLLVAHSNSGVGPRLISVLEVESAQQRRILRLESYSQKTFTNCAKAAEA